MSNCSNSETDDELIDDGVTSNTGKELLSFIILSFYRRGLMNVGSRGSLRESS